MASKQATKLSDRDNVIDVTDRIQEYKKGKTLTCDCGQGIGVEYGTSTIDCATCSNLLVDTLAGEREPAEEDGGGGDGGEEMDQTNLGDFL